MSKSPLILQSFECQFKLILATGLIEEQLEALTALFCYF